MQGSFPVSLLHIELSGATSGATKIDESEIPLSVHSLSPTRWGGGVSNPVVVNPNPTTSSSNYVFSGDESSSSAFDMESLKAGLATVSTISRDHAKLKGRVSRLEGKFEHWEEVLNQIELRFPIDIDTNLKEEVEFLTSCSQTLPDSLKQRIEACGESNTYFRSKISELEMSMKIIGNKNVELQDTINSLGKAAGNGGANFSPSLLELKKMQEDFSHLRIELETRFAEELPQFGSKQGAFFIFKSPPPLCFVRVLMFEFFSLPHLEQRIQEALSEQETKWQLLFRELHLKVDKSRDLYDFCVDLLKSGGIRFWDEVTAGSINPITPSKPEKQD